MDSAMVSNMEGVTPYRNRGNCCSLLSSIIYTLVIPASVWRPASKDNQQWLFTMSPFAMSTDSSLPMSITASSGSDELM